MTAVVIVCFLAQGLLAYPTGQYDADVASMNGAVYPVEGEAAFRGTAPAPELDSGSVSIYGKCDGSYVPIPEPSLLFFEDLPVQENYEIDVLSDTARFGSVLADSILAEREAEIEAKLAEIDAFVESKFGQINSQVTSTLLNINDAIDSDLEYMKLRDELYLENYDDLESEPELALTAQLDAKITADMANTESLVMKELTKVDSLVDSELKKTEALMESEIEKVNSYIESKIAQNDALMESEVSKINAFIDSELAKTEALMQLELEKMDSFVESELAKTECMMTSQLSKLNAIMDSKFGNDESATYSELAMLEVPVEVEFSGVAPTSGRTNCIYGNTGYIPVLTNLDSNYEGTFEEMTQPAVGEVEFYDTVPVSGRTRIVGYTGYLEPNLTPLKATPAVKRFDDSKAVPVNDVVAIIPDIEIFNYNNVDTIPVVREVVFSGKAPAVGRVKITGNCGSPTIIDYDDAISETQLINLSGVTGYDKVPETVPVAREAVFSGKAPAQGSVQIVGSCPCPVFPLNPPIVGNCNPSILNNNVQQFNADLYLNLANTESGVQNVPNTDGVFFPINTLPIVNVMRKEMKVNENGDVEFSATVRVAGNTQMAAQFDCAPLLPTEETPDGRKFIWLSKKSSSDETPASPLQTSNNPPKIDIPITTYSTDFPETIIMDCNKNYERFLDSHEEVIPVAGEVFFEGVAPAYGSVNIRGQSSC